MCRGHISEFSTEQIQKYEKNMRKGHASTIGFIDSNENLLGVYHDDLETLDKINITHKQISDRLKTIIGKFHRKISLVSLYGKYYNPLLEKIHEEQLAKVDPSILLEVIVMSYPNHKQTIGKLSSIAVIENRYLVGGKNYWGFQHCPFQGGLDNVEYTFRKETGGDWDFVIFDLETNKYIVFNNLLIHLIGNHSFFEGNVFHRLDPRQIIEFLDLKSDVDYTPIYQQIWEFNHIQIGGCQKTVKTNDQPTEATCTFEKRLDTDKLKRDGKKYELYDMNQYEMDDEEFLYVDITNANKNDTHYETMFEGIKVKHRLGSRNQYESNLVTSASILGKYKRELVNYVAIEEENLINLL